ncbi:MAG: hypothetical protein O9270_08145 [Aquidulcibacter sp.]|nr:hypothetical protein [Aquidulcibacter sp.]
MDVEELTPHVRHAGHFLDFGGNLGACWRIERIEPRIAVSKEASSFAGPFDFFNAVAETTSAKIATAR